MYAYSIGECQLTHVGRIPNACRATLGVVALQTALCWQSGATPAIVAVSHGHDSGTNADTCLLTMTLGLVVVSSIILEAGGSTEAASICDWTGGDCRYRLD